MKEIALIKTHRVAMVDDEDYEFLSQYRWYCSYQRNNYYAVCLDEIDGYPIPTGMHRLLMKATKGIMVDHADCNGLNNQKINLRLANYIENSQNRRPNKGCQYKGVRRKGDKYFAVIHYNKNTEYLGTFKTRNEAAMAYNEAALKYHGRFARVNIIDSLPLYYKLMMLSR